MSLFLSLDMRYIVTCVEDNDWFEVGDHIWRIKDGSILCKEAGAWINKEDAAEAMCGIKVEVDASWLEKQKARHAEQAEQLNQVTDAS